MELLKKRLKYFEPIYEQKAVYEETADIIVPDSSPDVLRVVGATGCATVKEKTAQNDRILISGTVTACVFYMPEEGGGLKRLTVPISFAHIEDTPGVSPEAVVCSDAQVLWVEAEMLNPRKLSVRANVMLCTTVYGEKLLEVTEGVGAPSEECVETKQTTVEISPIVSMQDKSFTLLDSVQPPEGSAVSITPWDVGVMTDEARIVAGKAVIKGTAQVKAFAMGADGSLVPKTWSFPFSQILEMDGVTEDADIGCHYYLKTLDFDLDNESEGRQWDVRITVGMFATCRVREKVTLLEDLYSTRYPVDSEMKMEALPKAACTETFKKQISEVIGTPTPVREVLGCRAVVSNQYGGGESSAEVAADLIYTILFRDTTGDVFALTKTFPVTFNTEGHPFRAADISIKNSVATAAPDGTLEVKSEAFLDIVGNNAVLTPHVTSAALGIDMPKAKGRNASIILRAAAAGESLWDTAKEYGSTVSDIMAANALADGEEPVSGRLLLIPLKK